MNTRPSPQDRQIDLVVRLLDEIEDLQQAISDQVERTGEAVIGGHQRLSQRRDELETRLRMALAELRLIDDAVPPCDHRPDGGELQCAPIVTLSHHSTILREAADLHHRRMRELSDSDHLEGLEELVAHAFAIEQVEERLVRVERRLREIRLSYADDGPMAAGERVVPRHICPLEPPAGLMSPRKREAVILFGLNRPVRVIAREMGVQPKSVGNMLTLAQDDWGVSREVLGMSASDHFRLDGCAHLDAYLDR
ncbi:MAG TPA: hypothetical protein VF228_14260 [Iamia sp.]